MQQTLDRGSGYKNLQNAKGSWFHRIRTQQIFQGLQRSTSSAEVGKR